MAYENLIHNIEQLSAEKGINKTTALIESGVGKNFIYNINKGSAPSIEKLQQLAAYFQISTDYLLGISNNSQTHNDTDPQTAEAVKLFANLPSDKKKLALKVIKVLLDDE